MPYFHSLEIVSTPYCKLFSGVHNTHMDKEHTKYLEACKARRLRAVKLKRKGLTLKEIGTLMGITRERVRQIVAKEAK